MVIKISLDEANRRLYEKHGNKITMFDYVRMNDYASFICNVCGYEWNTEAGNVINMGTGCEICYKTNKKENHLGKLSDNDVRKFIESQNCLWVSGEYENNRSTLEIQFSCGCKRTTSFMNFRNGHRCYIHQRQKAAESRRKTLDEIISDVESYGFVFIEKIENNKTGRKIRIAYKCSLGHRTERDYKDFYTHPTCESCKLVETRNRLSNSKEDIINIVESNGCFLKEIEYYENEKNSKLLIEFSCGHKEYLSLSNFRGRTTGLCNDCVTESVSGKNSYLWSGGLTPLTQYIRHNLSEWNEKSARFYDYKCVITGKSMEHIHHLQSFNLLLKEATSELDFKIKNKISNYSQKELDTIVNKFLEIQDKYPLGVPITKDIHHLFHSYYGRGNNTPEQFYEFQSRIASGEISIPN